METILLFSMIYLLISNVLIPTSILVVSKILFSIGKISKYKYLSLEETSRFFYLGGFILLILYIIDSIPFLRNNDKVKYGYKNKSSLNYKKKFLYLYNKKQR